MSSDPKKWGVLTSYEDALGHMRDAPPDTVEAILASMGANSEGPEGRFDGPIVLVQGDTTTLEGEWHITTEDGGARVGTRCIPRDLPLGYHRLTTEAGERSLIITPNVAKDFDDVRSWGWAAQLYALRSKASWGIGDLGDLCEFGRLAKRGGADFVLVNPLHASIPSDSQQSSPYYPSSREFRNPLYIDIAHVPGANSLENRLLNAGRMMNGDRKIDRDAIFKLKMEALSELWQRFSPDDRLFSAYRNQQGDALRRYATYCVLHENYGTLWKEWPESLRHPESHAVTRFAESHNDRVLFHEWLQWLLDVQLARAGREIDLINDLAIGVDPAGADAWLWQDAFALNMRVGAPPDEFVKSGQDWGLPPFDPWKLRKVNYEPFIRTIRANLAHAGGLRIDHVMGLFRLYWIPDGASAKDGTYVQYPYGDLLGILCLESVRSGAYVVGEDLGTVERYMREELAMRNIASYRLLWFEEDPPSEFPKKSMAAITTHDLPTVVGMWSGSDLEQQRKLGQEPNVESTEAIKARVAEVGNIDHDAQPDVAVDGCHELLADASSALVSVTLEDALRLSERPNYPGTTFEWPNWSLALPVALEDLGDHPGFVTTQRIMSGKRHEMPYHDSHDPRSPG